MKADRVADPLLTLRFAWRRAFGLPGLAGMLMLGAAGITYAAIAGVESDTRAIQAPAGVVRAAHGHRPADVRGTAVDAATLDTLPELFPRFSQSADDIASIFEQARDSHLALGSAEYQMTTESGARFARYQVLLPVKDQYGAIRHFLASVLNNVPNAALQEIHVERPAVGSSILDARVRFELVYRSAQP
ncbi:MULTISPECIES: hypothetical protein [unclassified Burkholderia]|uniref:hypothetical protein n=1 Tax=unclassified Burkholderia TaxID=2613784 RepID=UPI000F583FD4|nr:MULTISPECIES: hypothetical protein [unclassified Burkholderia]RQR35368.1 hypothetical protein DIE22_15340 [Burkholderia sp. Bp9142]RQR48998.1 hypothetical protein DIE21_20770 [Burkholderia sp. Bp9140]